MDPIKQRNILGLVLLALLPVSYFAGGVSGFAKGYAAAQFSQSGEIAWTVSVLRALRSGQSTSAIGVLEAKVDNLLVQNSSERSQFASVFNLPRVVGVGSEATIDSNASAALAYRSEYPSSLEGGTRAAVDAALQQLAKRARK